MRKIRFKRGAIALFCCLCLLTAAGGALAQVDMQVEMGYHGVTTYLRRLPVTVTITNDGGDVTGELTLDVDRTETSYDRYAMPLTIAAGATLRVTLPVTLSTKQSEYTATWRENGESVAETTVSPTMVANPATLLVGVLSQKPQALSYLTITQYSDALSRGEYWQTMPLDEESFPSARADLDFFDMLVVDGVDVGTLSAEQQQALDGWLKAGGIVLVSGGAQAATDFPYFAKYTNIQAKPLKAHEDVSAELLKLFSMSQKPLGESSMISPLSLGDGLVCPTAVENGYVFTAAFSLSEKPLSTWMGKNVIWQRMLLEYVRGPYGDMVTKRANGGADMVYVDSGVVNDIPVDNEGGVALPVIILGIFVALVGFGGYFLLKKLDRSDLMWVTVPGLCLLAALLIWGASKTMNIQEPIAVSYTVLKIDQEGGKSANTFVTVAQAQKGPRVISLAEGAINMRQATSYYYDQGESADKQQRQLRYEYIYGKPEQVCFSENGIWTQTEFVADNAPLLDVSAQGFSSWEGEKLCFTVTNNGSVPLSDGLVMANCGYVTTPRLLPGESATVELAKSGKGTEIKEGVLLTNAQMQSAGFYDFLNSYFQTKRMKELPAGERSARNSLLQSNYRLWDSGMTIPYYISFPEQIADVGVVMNGKPVTRTGQLGMVCAELSFNPVAKDGTVRYLSGTIAVCPAELNDAGKPYAAPLSASASGRYLSYRLADEPVFAFDLKDAPTDWSMEHLDISPRNSYYGYQVELYQPKTGKWTQFKTHEFDQQTGKEKDKTQLPKLADVTDEDGMLYARFSSYGKTEDYADIYQPTLSMDGRLN